MISIIHLFVAIFFSYLWVEQSIRIARRLPIGFAMLHWFVGAIFLGYAIAVCLRQIFL